ncbi:MAG: DedA family protein [Candidatus Sungiibacteriota bacterium]
MTPLLAFIFIHPAMLYILFLILLALGGTGISLPDEVVLIFLGYLAHLEFINLWIAVIIAVIGLVMADIVGYLMGRFAGELLIRLISHSRRAAAIAKKAEDLFIRHGDKIIILSRPLMSVRVAVPMFAGHTRMPLRKFLLLDALAAIPWAAGIVLASFVLGSQFDLIADIRAIKHYFFAALGLAIILYVGVRFLKSAAPSQSPPQ